jgi:ABC-2 type transport system ATP-binding protein
LRAVDGLSFTVKRGEVFALLGPNGAGKTTTVEMLEGYRKPDGGELRVLGLDPLRAGRAVRERIGLMLQATALYDKITVWEALRLFTSYYARGRDPRELLDLIGLRERRDARFEDLSGGQKQRLSLGLALAGNPELVFLDEPTAAMDPQARLQTWEIVEGLRRGGVTVVLTTHYMEEAQRLADHVAIVDHGRLVAFGTPAELTALSGGEVVTFTARGGLDAADLQDLPGAADVRQPRPGEWSLTTSDAVGTVAGLARLREARGLAIERLTVTGASLEDVFLQLTGNEVRD